MVVRRCVAFMYIAGDTYVLNATLRRVFALPSRLHRPRFVIPYRTDLYTPV